MVSKIGCPKWVTKNRSIIITKKDVHTITTTTVCIVLIILDTAATDTATVPMPLLPDMPKIWKALGSPNWKPKMKHKHKLEGENGSPNWKKKPRLQLG
jgi:hypothetical protein